MKKVRSIIIFTFLFLSGQVSAQFDAALNSIIQKVNIDSLFANLEILSGNRPVYLNGKIQSIHSRYRSSYGNMIAAEFIQKKLLEYNLNPYKQDFYNDGTNIYGIQTGNKYPNQKIIICAHYDCMPADEIAPGADDNGSGTVAVLEIARVLSKIQSQYTIIYAFWDLEEQGLLGSDFYAKIASTNKDSIIAVLNLDMVGWDKDDDGKAEIHTQDIKNSNALAEQLKNLNNDFSIDLDLKIVIPGNPRSDHASFWRYGYSAIMLIESFSDFNQYYHKATDNIDYINRRYFEKMVKLSLGMISKTAKGSIISNIDQNNIPTTFTLTQNFPNPFNPKTRIRYQLKEADYVRLEIFDALGNSVIILVDDFQKPNWYEVNIDHEKFSSMSSGVYFYLLKTSREFEIKKMIFLK